MNAPRESAPQRHNRLFELIRQQNLIEERRAQNTNAARDPIDEDGFIAAASASLQQGG